MYDEHGLMNKLANEVSLFSEIFKLNELTESEIPHFRTSLNEVYNLAKELYEETNVFPLMSNVQLRNKKVLNELTENQIGLKIWEGFRKDLDKKYIQPLTEGTLYDINKDKTTQVLKCLTIVENDADPEISKNYALFESSLFEAIKDVIIPKDNILQMSKYVNELPKDYFDIFDRNVKTIKIEFNEALACLVSNIAVKMFKKGIQFSEEYNKDDYDLEKYKGISKIFDTTDELDTELDKFEISPKVKFEHDSELDALNEFDEDELDEKILDGDEKDVIDITQK